jgi:hypothetical protein
MFYYFKIPYFTCTFFTKYIYNEYIGTYFLSHVVSKIFASELPEPGASASLGGIVWPVGVVGGVPEWLEFTVPLYINFP